MGNEKFLSYRRRKKRAKTKASGEGKGMVVRRRWGKPFMFSRPIMTHEFFWRKIPHAHTRMDFDE